MLLKLTLIEQTCSFNNCFFWLPHRSAAQTYVSAPQFVMYTFYSTRVNVSVTAFTTTGVADVRKKRKYGAAKQNTRQEQPKRTLTDKDWPISRWTAHEMNDYYRWVQVIQQLQSVQQETIWNQV